MSPRKNGPKDTSSLTHYAATPAEAIADANTVAGDRAKKERRSVRKVAGGGDEDDGEDDPSQRRLHLDRRAPNLIAEGKAPGEHADDDLISTLELANWLGVSPQWVELARSGDYGPLFIKVGPQMIRYRRSDVIAWLEKRVVARTSDYAEANKARRKTNRRKTAA
jgi:hypothetical protein